MGASKSQFAAAHVQNQMTLAKPIACRIIGACQTYAAGCATGNGMEAQHPSKDEKKLKASANVCPQCEFPINLK